jgi:hypothetical protein
LRHRCRLSNFFVGCAVSKILGGVTLHLGQSCFSGAENRHPAVEVCLRPCVRLPLNTPAAACSTTAVAHAAPLSLPHNSASSQTLRWTFAAVSTACGAVLLHYVPRTLLAPCHLLVVTAHDFSASCILAGSWAAQAAKRNYSKFLRFAPKTEIIDQ